uniref:GH16 domain-containing protein n=1 Tax=Colwellia sp. An23 TaxID=1719924 RepID=A0A110BGV2_9GAMM|nr:hypothetical protein [Colwellia sp. An23]
MKKSLHLNLLAASVLTAAVSTGVQAANTTWQFNGSNPIQNGWSYDLDSRNGDEFNIKFVRAHAKASGGQLVLTSESWDDTKAVRKGGGIEKADGLKNNRFEVSCDMDQAIGHATVKRSQASFWLDKKNQTASYEVDMFELKPNQGPVVNFISWVKDPSNPGYINSGKLAKRAGSGHTSQNKSYEWGGSRLNAIYKLDELGTGSTKQGIFKYKVTKKLGSNTETHSYNMSEKRDMLDTIIIHNKPWRLGQVSIGPTATLKCDWARRPTAPVNLNNRHNSDKT